MARNTYDPETVEQVAQAMRAYDDANTDEESLFGSSFTELSTAALDALTELGWRPGFTEQEREAINRVADFAGTAVELVDWYEVGSAYYVAKPEEFAETIPERIRYDIEVLRALLAGGRHG